MSDTSTPTGTDLNSAQSAISAMLAPVEDNATEPEALDVSQDDTSEMPEDDLEYEAHAEDKGEYEGDHEDDGDEDHVEDQTFDILSATVEVDGEELTVEDLKDGHLRQRDYTRKTQELAEARKAMEAEYLKVTQERQQYDQLLPLLAERIEQSAQEEPDWDTLYDADPAMASKAERQFRKQQEERKAQLQAVRAEQERMRQMEVQRVQAAQTQYLEQQRQLLPDIIPEWRDSTVAKSEAGKLRTFLIGEGFAEQDVAGLANANLVKIARKAMLYDQGQTRATEAKKKPKKRGPKPLRSGSKGSQPKAKSETQKAQQRLRQTGRVQDSQAAIKTLL